MKAVIRFGTLALVFVLGSCASKPAYQDQAGRRLESIPSYQPHAGPGQTAVAPEVASASSTAGEAATPQVWPRRFVSGNTTNTIYQLQVDAWDGSALTGRNAVAVQSAGQPDPVYGVITVRATTMVDKSDRTVSLLNLQVIDADFPTAPEQKEVYLGALRERYPSEVQVLSLDSLEASLAANAERLKTSSQALNNDPPDMIFSEKPAVLVSIDGEPAWRPVEGTELERVLNTRALILKNSAGELFLRLGDNYYQAEKLAGPWQPGSAPAGAETAEKLVTENASQPQGLTDTALEAPPNDVPVPEIHVVTKPTELIVFSGTPNYVPISGTQLLYVTNTTGNVFKLLSDQKNYVLLSGRWFRSGSFAGPWEHVPGSALPIEFARIPDDSPKENVKASIPGTPQAREAFIANSIPQTTGLARTNQLQDLQIDGTPQLKPIAGTPLQYVENSATPIIKVDENSWYACQDGAWYVASSVDGPWLVADSVPAVIYSIPPSSPMHYVTYVRVYNATESVVFQGYTPGYLGTVVDTDAVVVYGTGYYYSPWVGSAWYAPPVTWGLGCGPFWAPWTGWSFGFGFGWYAGYYRPYPFYGYWSWWYPPYPYWGPYYYDCDDDDGFKVSHPGHPAHTSVNLYKRSLRQEVVAEPVAASRTIAASNRALTSYGRAYNSRTGGLVAGEQARVQNVFRSPRGAPTARAALPVRDAYATSDGQVYTRTGPENRGTWRSVARPDTGSRTAPAPSVLGLERERAARASGNERSATFQRSEMGGRMGAIERSGGGNRSAGAPAMDGGGQSSRSAPASSGSSGGAGGGGGGGRRR